MRRAVFGVIVFVAAVAGAAAYATYATAREYDRLIADGDRAATMDEPFLALEAYSGAVALRPESMLAHLKRGMTYRDQGELEAAVRDLRQAAELDVTATLPLELLGDTYLALHRHDRAAERYEAYLALDDRSPGVWYKLGLARYREGQPVQAIAAIERALALNGGLADAHVLLGLCRRDRSDFAGARNAFETATRLAPALTAPREALASVYSELGDHSRAIDQLEALAALDPTNPRRFAALGLAHARARRHEAAVVTLSRAVERFPNEPRIYGALGRVWLQAADARHDPVVLRKAIEALGAAASHPEVTSEALADLGRAWLMAGDPVAAERALRRAVDRLPIEPDAYLQLANLAARADRWSSARDDLIRWVGLVAGFTPTADAALRIATYSLALGEPAVALRWVERAVDEAGDSPALARVRDRALAVLATQEP